jgi:hypothetical protein
VCGWNTGADDVARTVAAARDALASQHALTKKGSETFS